MVGLWRRARSLGPGAHGRSAPGAGPGAWCLGPLARCRPVVPNPGPEPGAWAWGPGPGQGECGSGARARTISPVQFSKNVSQTKLLGSQNVHFLNTIFPERFASKHDGRAQLRAHDTPGASSRRVWQRDYPAAEDSMKSRSRRHKTKSRNSHRSIIPL